MKLRFSLLASLLVALQQTQHSLESEDPLLIPAHFPQDSSRSQRKPDRSCIVSQS